MLIKLLSVEDIVAMARLGTRRLINASDVSEDVELADLFDVKFPRSDF